MNAAGGPTIMSDTGDSRVRCEKKEHVACATLDRPAVLNAMDLRMHEEPARSGMTPRPTVRCGPSCRPAPGSQLERPFLVHDTRNHPITVKAAG
jgi:hypothetical protein